MANHQVNLGARQLKHKQLAEVLIEAVGGAKAAVDYSRVEKSQIYSYCSENTADFMPSDVVEDLERIARRPIVTEYLARRLGYVLVPLALADEDPDGILQSVMDLTSELGDVAQSIRDGLRDGKFTAIELRAALDQLAELDHASAILRRKLEKLLDAVAPEAPTA